MRRYDEISVERIIVVTCLFYSTHPFSHMETTVHSPTHPSVTLMADSNVNTTFITTLVVIHPTTDVQES